PVPTDRSRSFVIARDGLGEACESSSVPGHNAHCPCACAFHRARARFRAERMYIARPSQPSEAQDLADAYALATAPSAQTSAGALVRQLGSVGRHNDALSLPDIPAPGERVPEHVYPISFGAALAVRLCVEGRLELAEALVTLRRGAGFPDISPEHVPDDRTL